jgi:hypothetical protein
MLTKENLEFLDNILVEIVTERGPIKGTELAVEFTKTVLEKNTFMNDITGIDVTSRLDNLVGERRIIEIEYVLPQLDFRVKSMYFPAETKLRVFS